MAQATGGGPAGISLRVKVGLPTGVLARLKEGMAVQQQQQQQLVQQQQPFTGAILSSAVWGSSSGGGNGNNGSGSSSNPSRVLLLLDFEAEALLAHTSFPAGSSQAPSHFTSAASSQLPPMPCASSAPSTQLPPAPHATSAPSQDQQHVDSLASRLASSQLPGVAWQLPGVVAGARVRELASLQQSVSAALRRVPQGLKERAYVSWLALHLMEGRELGWSRQAVAAAAAGYARAVGEVGRGEGLGTIHPWQTSPPRSKEALLEAWDAVSV